MQRILSSLILILGTVFGVEVGAEPMVAGQVRLASGEPVAGAHVRLFDLRDLRWWVGATTDESGSFALPLGALSSAAVQPAQFSLGSNYPNPFNPATVIPYRLQQPMLVRLEVFNVLGQHIATLVDGEQAEGFYTARWDGTDAAGAAVAAGMYLYRLSGEGVQATQSMVLIDGQAGIPAGSSGGMPQDGVEATEATSVYGLTVSGPGLTPFVNPVFRVAAGPMDLVVEASAGLSRAKAAFSEPCSSGGVLGDVDNNDRVDFFDALLVALYSEDTSTIMPNSGDISLGDVNADGRIDLTDAYLIAGWLNDSADPTLPAGIGDGGGGASPDCAALVALYEATGGDNWENNADWLSDEPLGEWFGVTTDDDGRVTKLELGGNDLSGALPSELGNLTNLQVLHLYENALSGALPASLGDLTSLRELDLYENDLSGALPSELGNLTNLEILYLDHNQLSGPLPDSLVNLTYLKWLNLRNTQLCAPTDDVFQGWLDGIENKRGVVNCEEDEGDEPDDRAALVALYEATNGDNWKDNTNWLSDRPLSQWHGVTTDTNGRVLLLILGDNGLSGALPAELGSLINLQWLDLSANALSGALPPALGSLADLQTLDLRNTQLCAPTDAAFQRWLNGIGTKLGVRDCGDLNPDRAALVALYEATDGDNWTNNTNWLSDRPLGEWFGVTTDDDGRVTGLSLARNQLSGSIPPELGNLSMLTFLDFQISQLSGSIPPELGNLTNLTTMLITFSQLSGSIPPELGNLTNLQWLGLWGNQLSGSIPPALGNLTNLQWLALTDNQLSGSIPSWLGNLTNLQQLGLGDNQLSGNIPPELGNLTNLQWLGLWGNQLSGSIPPALGNLTNLQWLGLDSNALEGELPRSLVNLTNVERLWLDTQLCAPTDAAFQTWLDGIDDKQGVVNCDEPGDPDPTNPDRAVLVALYEATNGDNWTNDTNWLSDRPLGEWFGVTTGGNGRVSRLVINDNGLSGTLPAELGSLTNLQWLDLSANALSGELPSSLGNLTNLRLLWLGANQFSGSFPSWLVNLTNLQQLQLATNQFSGSLPSWLGTLTNLQDLRLQYNQFSGSLPAELGNLTRLVRLYLHENKALLDPLPSSLVKLTNLQQLYLENTQLCAPTDAAFQMWLDGIDDKQGVVNCDEPGDPDPANPDRAALVALYEATDGDNWTNNTNWLSDRPLGEWFGVIADANGRVTSLELDRNNLSGSLPASLGNLTNLQGLSFFRNQLSGSIPSSLVNLTNLEWLVLDFNAFSGSVPSWLGDLTNLRGLRLGHNNFSGSVPSSLVNLTSLSTLGLNDNDFSGSVPSWLGDLTNLQRLRLGHNDFSGSIPSSLGSLTNLTGLDLSGLQLSGTLPSWLGNLTNLNELILSDNDFSGSVPSWLGDLTNLYRLHLHNNQLSGGAAPVVEKPR